MDIWRPLLRFKLLILIGILFLSCEEIDYNPLDSANPDYIPPETFITMEALEGAVLDTSTVTITWSGNDLVVEYAYSLNDDWSGWSADTSVTLNYLDEGDYTFSVKGRYAPEVEDESPATVNFSVDMVQGPALRVYTLLTEMSVDNTANVDIYAEEVDSLMSATITLSYDTASLEIVSVSQGDMFAGTGESVFIYEDGSGTITIHTMFMGGDSPYVSGTGSLAAIVVKALVLGSHNLSLDGAQLLKTHTNRSISIIEKVNGLVVVE